MQERDLDAHWNIREHAQVHFRSLDDFYFPLDDFLGRRELLCTQPDAVALDPDPPFAVRERRALCRASNRYGYPAFMTLDVFDLTRSQLVALAGEDVQESSMALARPKFFTKRRAWESMENMDSEATTVQSIPGSSHSLGQLTMVTMATALNSRHRHARHQPFTRTRQTRTHKAVASHYQLQSRLSTPNSFIRRILASSSSINSRDEFSSIMLQS